MIKIIQGDRRTFRCTAVKQSDGSAFDLTNYNITMSIKRSLYDTAYLLQKTVGNGITKVVPESNGIFEIDFYNVDTATADPGEYYYDIELEDTGTGEPYTIVAPSKFIIELGVTT